MWPAGRVASRGARPWLALAAALLVAGGVGYLVFFSPVFAVDRVEVVGARDEPVQEVRAVAGVRPGSSMARLDTDAIAARLSGLPRLAGVTVQRRWPSTVVLRVSERTPVAVAPGPGGPRLVDRTGFAYAPASGPTPGLPELTASQVSPQDAGTVAAMLALAAIPAPVRAALVAVHADGPYDVVFRLTGGRQVRWGGAAGSDRKAAVLVPLLSQPGTSYDVSSPDLPTVRR